MMSKMARRVCLFLAVLCIVIQPNEAALGSECTSENADSVCKIDNAECTDDKCACQKDYKAKDGACVEILGTECTSENADTVCTVDNAECTNGTCACKKYYKNKDGACVQILSNDCETDTNCAGVPSSACKESKKCECKGGYMTTTSGTHCTEVLKADCSSDGTICESLTNSACTDGKCACAANYEVSGKVCLKVAEQSCTSNAECASGKCDGETGSKTCSKKSTASSVTVASGLIVVTSFLTLCQHFF